jgi:hypothetical protein
MFPTATKGSGLLRSNNRPAPKNPSINLDSPRRKVSCLQCGFLCDLSRQVPSGGDLGGGGAYAGSTIELTDAGYSGEGNLQAGAGCPFCGSKNFAASRAGHINQEA